MTAPAENSTGDSLAAHVKNRAVNGFCGAGGASQGLHEAGYEVVGFDKWPVAVATHLANGLPAHVHDLADETLDDLIPECDLMWLSPPCQPFSAAGDGEGEFDERDGFPWALRIIAKRLPAVVIFENVKGLTFAKHAVYFGGILAALHGLGYEIDWRVLNTADYGVPQTRERTIVVARRDGGRITWPTVTHTEHEGMFTERWVMMADALGWGMTDRPMPTIATSSPTGGPRMDGAGGAGGAGSRAIVTGERDAGRWILNYRRNGGATGEPITCDITDRPSPTICTKSAGQWVFERPATTITGDCRVSAPGRHDPEMSGSQQADAIKLTIDELARLQDFPPGWQWCGTKTDQARQVGNAVPRTLARLVAEANRPHQIPEPVGARSSAIRSTSPAADSCAPDVPGGAVSGANARDRNPRA